MSLLSRIAQSYKYNKPDIKEMEKLAITIGCTVRYEHDIFQRWFRWLFLYDCLYEVKHNEGDMRNYTA